MNGGKKDSELAGIARKMIRNGAYISDLIEPLGFKSKSGVRTFLIRMGIHYDKQPFKRRTIECK